MAGKTTAFSNAFLQLIFNAIPIANLADNTATSPATNLYLSLHTADPGVGGNQTTNEIAYTGYTRVALVRTSSGWTIVSNSCSPNSTVSFPAGSGGSGTATYVGVGLASSGTGTLLYSGALTPNIVCGSGVTPQLTTASTITES